MYIYCSFIFVKRKEKKKINIEIDQIFMNVV